MTEGRVHNIDIVRIVNWVNRFIDEIIRAFRTGMCDLREISVKFLNYCITIIKSIHAFAHHQPITFRPDERQSFRIINQPFIPEFKESQVEKTVSYLVMSREYLVHSASARQDGNIDPSDDKVIVALVKRMEQFTEYVTTWGQSPQMGTNGAH